MVSLGWLGLYPLGKWETLKAFKQKKEGGQIYILEMPLW